MFVIGIQLKILIGLLMLFILVGTLPTISNFIFEEMLDMMRLAIEVLNDKGNNCNYNKADCSLRKRKSNI